MPRSETMDPLLIETHHIWTRCVRRAFLMGHDPVTGFDYSHRRMWLFSLHEYLASVLMVDVGSPNILSNHLHDTMRSRPDLVKLMTGSHGALGVLTEVSLKVLPKPEATGVLLIDGLSDDDAVAAMSLALGSPFEVTGAAHAPEGVDGHPVTMIRIEGFDESVSYRLSQLTELLGKFGEVAVETRPERTRAGWQWVRDLEVFEGLEGNLWKLSVKPSDAPILAARLGGAKRLYDWGGGLLWILLDEGTDPRAQMGDIAGHATLVRGSGHPRFHPETQGVAMLSQGLRQKFDPRGILNPGLMG